MTLQSLLLILMMLAVFGGIISGIPVMFVLMGVPLFFAGIGIVFEVFDFALIGAMPSRIFGIMGNQILYSVPLFVLMGKVLEHSGIAERILLSGSALANNRARSMALSVLLLSVVIAASTGIVGATISMLGTIALPAMLRSGISERLSAGLVCAAGSLGQIIPPSIVLILLSDQVSNAYISAQREVGNFAPDPVSVGHLFAGAILPGLLLAFCYAIYVGFSLREVVGNNEQKSPVSEKHEKLHPAIFLSACMMVFAVPGSIITGIASPTEAAAIGVAGALLLAISGDIKGTLKKALRESVEITGMIFGIIIAASVLSLVFRGFEGDVIIQDVLGTTPHASTWALLSVMALVFLLGFVIEFVEITYIVVPLAAPFLFSLGIDPIWFAILMAVNLQISFLTPPLGIALFYLKSVSGIKMPVLYRAIVPFVGIQLIVLAILIVFPSLATWLPSILI